MKLVIAIVASLSTGITMYVGGYILMYTSALASVVVAGTIMTTPDEKISSVLNRVSMYLTDYSQYLEEKNRRMANK